MSCNPAPGDWTNNETAYPIKGMQPCVSFELDGDDPAKNDLRIIAANSKQDVRHHRTVDLVLWHTGFDGGGAPSSSTVYLKLPQESALTDTPYKFDNTASIECPYIINGLPLPSNLTLHVRPGNKAVVKVKALIHYHGPYYNR